MDPYKLTLKQVSGKLKPWLKLHTQSRPIKGWIHTIRQALGMTTIQLAKRLNVSQSRVVQLEKAEINNAITLTSLSKAAKAMECELVYAIVPRTTLQNILNQQALKIAKRQLERVSHSMKLENQGVTSKQSEAHLRVLIRELIQGNPKKIWGDK